MGTPDFYGRGPQFAVNTLEPMKVVTQFITSDGTDDGDLVDIKRFYVQNGNIIHSPSSTILGPDHDTDSITDAFCDAKKDLFGDVKDYQEHGGMKGMGESLDRGHVMIFSLWDDVEVNMLWLDSAYPLNKPVTDPGIKRGECPGDETSTPTWLRQNYSDAYVTFKNAAVGEIGSTVGPVTPTTPSPVAAPSPVASPVTTPTTPGSGYCNYRGCDGEPMGGPWCNETQERCEGNCSGTWCTNGPPPTPPTTPNPTASPTNSPTTSPTSSPDASCSDNPTDAFFFKFKTLSDGTKRPIIKTCDWLAGKNTSKINNICTKKTTSYGGLGPAKDICKALCGTC